MVKYICKQCFTEFKQKEHYTNHLKENNSCKENKIVKKDI